MRILIGNKTLNILQVEIEGDFKFIRIKTDFSFIWLQKPTKGGQIRNKSRKKNGTYYSNR